jgi:hypothetical protein
MGGPSVREPVSAAALSGRPRPARCRTRIAPRRLRGWHGLWVSRHVRPRRRCCSRPYCGPCRCGLHGAG